MSPKPEYHKFVDDQVRARQHEHGVGRLQLALFVAALGPAAQIISKVASYPLNDAMMLGVYATAPLGLFLLILNYLRLPAHSKGTKPAMSIVFLTILAVVATFGLKLYFSRS